MATVVRNYRNRDGEWDSTGSFRTSDLPLVQRVITLLQPLMEQYSMDDADIPFS